MSKPETWLETRVGVVTKVVMGQSPPSTAVNQEGRGIPFFQGNGEFGALHPMPKNWIEKPVKTASPNDVLLSVRAPVGAINIANRLCGIGRGLCAVQASEHIDPHFLPHVLMFGREKLEQIGQGSTFDAIGGKEVRDLQIRLPPLAEQKKIAEILGSVDDAIAATKAVIEQTKQVKQGLLQELLTKGIGHTKFKQTEIGEIPESWEVVGLLDVLQIANGQVDPRVQPYSDMPLVAPNHLEEGTGRLLNIETAAAQQAISGKYLFYKDEVIYSKIRPYLRKVWLADRDGLCSADMYPFKAGDRLLPAFAAIVLLSDHFTEFANSMSARTGIPKINRVELEQFRFGLPPKSEQETIAEFISRLDEVSHGEGARGDSLREIKSGLLQDLLTGKVRVSA